MKHFLQIYLQRPFRLLLKIIQIVVFSLLLFPSSWVLADTLVLINGDRFSGKLLKREGNQLQFQTEYAGSIKVLWKHVQALYVDQTAILLLNDGTTKKVHSVEIKNDEIIYLDSVQQKHLSLDIDQVIGVSTEVWEENKVGFWDGEVNFSVRTERGSGDEGYVDIDADMTYRRLNDRYRITGELENDSKENETTDETRTTKDKWNLRGEYNYFFDKKYVGALASLEHDPLADLNLRAGVGPLAGYQFFESDPLYLKAEFGMLIVNEDYEFTEDQVSLMPVWHLNFKKYVLNNWFQFYHEQFGLVNLDSDDQWLFRCWTGFRFPIDKGIQVTAEYKLEYDHKLIEKNNDSAESVFKLKLGYKW